MRAKNPSSALGSDGLPAPLDDAKPPPHDRFCDLVMKGGVVDGVLYPWAILELARHYRFKNLGGTSVGAMAAGLAAAAEYGRRYGSNTGFNTVLRELPQKLAEPVPGTDRTRLLSLFHPKPRTRLLFDVFVRLLGSKRSGWVKGFALMGLFLPALGWAAGLVTALVLGLGMPEGGLRWGVALVLAVMATLVVWGVLALAQLWRGITQGAMQNHFGLCTGATVVGPGHTGPGLIEWLHEGIQGASGRPLHAPLTFQDLWNAPGGPSSAGVARDSAERSIDLHVMSTNLTHSRPYAFPLAMDENRLFFKLEEMAEFFPSDVVNHLAAHGKPYRPIGKEDPDEKNVAREIFELPRSELPILVAVRLSLSFPVLFSSVPLWAIDYTDPLAQRTVKRCRFSDGGLCANFPIHVFDSALPRWPTFGITLDREDRRGQRPAVWMPQFHTQGRGDAWQSFEAKPSAWGQIAGAANSLLDAMREWNDTASARLAGVRERIVHVNLNALDAASDSATPSSFSGLDLEISGEKILKMAEQFGVQAGQCLVNTYVPGEASEKSAGRNAWAEHRWIRFQTFALALRERILGFQAARQGPPQSQDVLAQIDAALVRPPLFSADGRELRLTPTQAESLRRVVDALEALESAFSTKAQADQVHPYQPSPRPEMHLRPPL